MKINDFLQSRQLSHTDSHKHQVKYYCSLSLHHQRESKSYPYDCTTQLQPNSVCLFVCFVQSVSSWQQRTEVKPMKAAAATSLWDCRAKTEIHLRSFLCTEFVVFIFFSVINFVFVLAVGQKHSILCVCVSGCTTGPHLLPIFVQDICKRPEKGLLPVRWLQSNTQTDASSAQHGGWRHNWSLDLKLDATST